VGLTAGFFEGDCALYYQAGQRWLAGQVPYRDFLFEYPPAVVTVIALVARCGDFRAFRMGFGLLCLLFDTAIGIMIWRADRSTTTRRGLATSAYAVATAILFPVLLVRFDLLPATFCAAGICLLHRDRPSDRRALAAGALLGLATALKLYPLLLAPFLFFLLYRATGRARAAIMLLAGACLVSLLSLLPVVIAGAGLTTLSFLRYHSQRGLQIESSYASVLLLGNKLMPLGLRQVPSHHAHQLAGALPDFLAQASRVLQPLAVIAATFIAARRRLDIYRGSAAILGTALLTAYVFSPQFLLWLLPLVALAACLHRDLWMAVLLVLIAALTTLVYPKLYDDLLQGRTLASLALAGRNLLLALLVFRLLRPGQDPEAADTAPSLCGRQAPRATQRAPTTKE
jgi:uncharacterized membrane protein